MSKEETLTASSMDLLLRCVKRVAQR